MTNNRTLIATLFSMGLITLSASCQKKDSSETTAHNEDDQHAATPMHKGFNSDGTFSECVIPKDTVCTEVFEPGDAFGMQCEKEGHEKFFCGCHTYLCSDKVTGDYLAIFKTGD